MSEKMWIPVVWHHENVWMPRFGRVGRISVINKLYSLGSMEFLMPLALPLPHLTISVTKLWSVVAIVTKFGSLLEPYFAIVRWFPFNPALLSPRYSKVAENSGTTIVPAGIHHRIKRAIWIELPISSGYSPFRKRRLISVSWLDRRSYCWLTW